MTTSTEPTPAQQDAEQSDRTKSLNQAYAAATKRLREQYRAEFDGLYQQEAEARGVTYTPRLTPQQKAQQQIETLLAAHPELREQVAASGAASA